MTDLAAANRIITDMYNTVGRNIARARHDRGLTQADLAVAVGLTRGSLTNIEAGRQRTPLHTTIAIAQALGVGLEDLLGDVPSLSPVLAVDTGRLRSKLEETRAQITALLNALPEEPLS